LALYTTLPHGKLTHLKETIQKAFSHRNDGSKFVVLQFNGKEKSQKEKKHTIYKALHRKPNL
jgi:hypothetical protein